MRKKLAVSIAFFSFLLLLASHAIASGGGSIIFPVGSSYSITISEDTVINANCDTWETVQGRRTAIGNDSGKPADIAIESGKTLTVNSSSSGNTLSRDYGIAINSDGSDFSLTGTCVINVSSDTDGTILRALRNNKAGLMSLSGDISVNLSGKFDGSASDDNGILQPYCHIISDTWEQGKTVFSGSKTVFKGTADGGSVDGIDLYNTSNASSAPAVELNSASLSIVLTGYNLRSADVSDQNPFVDGLHGVDVSNADGMGGAVVEINSPTSIKISGDNFFSNGGLKIGNNFGLRASGAGAVINVNNDISIDMTNDYDYCVAAKGGHISINKDGTHDVQLKGAMECAGSDGSFDLTVNKDTSFSAILSCLKGHTEFTALNGAVMSFEELGLQDAGTITLTKSTAVKADRLLVSGSGNKLVIARGASFSAQEVMTESYAVPISGDLTVYVSPEDRANVVIPSSPNLTVTYVNPQSSGSSGGCSAGFGMLALLAVLPAAVLRKKK